MAAPRVEIRAVFFDLGGTLIDYQDYLAWSEVARGLSLGFGPEELAHAFEEVEQETDREEPIAQDRLTQGEFWRRTLARASGVEVSAETAERFLRSLARLEVPSRLYSDVRRCLDELREERRILGVISNSRSERAVREILERARILRYFSSVTSSGSENVAKPSVEIFRRALEKERVRAEHAFYVGNLAFTDAEAARRAGMRSVWLNRKGTAFNFDPPEVTSLLEVPNWIRRLEGRPERYPTRRA